MTVFTFTVPRKALKGSTIDIRCSPPTPAFAAVLIHKETNRPKIVAQESGTPDGLLQMKLHTGFWKYNTLPKGEYLLITWASDPKTSQSNLVEHPLFIR